MSVNRFLEAKEHCKPNNRDINVIRKLLAALYVFCIKGVFILNMQYACDVICEMVAY